MLSLSKHDSWHQETRIMLRQAQHDICERINDKSNAFPQKK